MPKYVILSKLTDEGRKTIKTNPERIKEVNKEMEKMGVKVEKQYALLGDYDFVTIFDAPDKKAMTKVAVEMGSRGTIDTVTMAAMSVDDFIDAMK
ncbi:MAG: GYD domain-containing protein [Candidatus Saliniplasma sp.]